MDACRLCGALFDALELDLGSLPVSNRFSLNGSCDRYPLSMIGCETCGLIQLRCFPPAEAVTPLFPWISYNEPEEHLDGAVARILRLLPRPPRRVLGTGPFDRPLLDRLTRSGAVGESLDLRRRHHDPNGPLYPYLESIQSRLSDGSVAAEADGQADVVLCRYVFEHCHSPVAALAGLGDAATPDGVVIVEVPDCGSFLRRYDYSFPWEEHVSYFTEQSLSTMATRAGFAVLDVIRSPGALEDSLMAVLQKRGRRPRALEMDTEGLSLFQAYRAKFTATREIWARWLLKGSKDGAKIAVFGAGHQAIMFVNALGLNELVTTMVDDNPAKLGMVAPGMTAPVISSAEMLTDPSFMTCLLAVSPRAEAAVMAKCAPLRDRGARFRSIFQSPDTDDPT